MYNFVINQSVFVIMKSNIHVALCCEVFLLSECFNMHTCVPQSYMFKQYVAVVISTAKRCADLVMYMVFVSIFVLNRVQPGKHS